MMIRHLIISSAAMLLLCVSCSTGIEGTKAIKMSRTEQRSLQPGEEEILISSIVPDTLKDWRPGKEFIITDDKASIVLENRSGYRREELPHLKGKTVRFSGISESVTPGGDRVAYVEFSDGSDVYRYNTARSTEAARSELTSLDIPMLTDLDLVKAADTLLRGRELWVLSPIRYDADGNMTREKKFVPVTVEEVTSGNMVFALKVGLIENDGRRSAMFMNLRSGSAGTDSRTFETLFALKDPKLKYPSIIPEVWELIRESRVRQGMTKEECRLALGNPPDVDSGHDWNQTIDIWKYNDGTFLRFEDGLLTSFRR